eukprot:TRINITY_DN12516_c1_g3_i1.p1 TRINITY_DN12516_c1_g3~~TRINITY_DN12516_c1_g3_i1.p1  ORF type:complete len:339 (+),score=62.92 TRINITY_DN12516_c1_g3_i1:70-1086(+)
MSDRLFLDDQNAALEAKLRTAILNMTPLPEHELQDFEVSYVLSSTGSLLYFQVNYAYMHFALEHGARALLERAWAALPFDVTHYTAGLKIIVDLESMGQDDDRKEHILKMLVYVRMFLLIGPLVEKLRFLRNGWETAMAKSKDAPAGSRKEEFEKERAKIKVPDILELQLRDSETVWIVSKTDRVLVILAVNLDDKTDIALGRAFCQEFAETNRVPNSSFLPCKFSEPKDVPHDLRDRQLAVLPSVGFLTLTLTDDFVSNASEDRLYALAKPVMTFRNFFLYHLKQAKGYLHSRLRKRLDGWQEQLKSARRGARKGQEKRRLVSGKEFVPLPGRLSST